MTPWDVGRVSLMACHQYHLRWERAKEKGFKVLLCLRAAWSETMAVSQSVGWELCLAMLGKAP